MHFFKLLQPQWLNSLLPQLLTALLIALSFSQFIYVEHYAWQHPFTPLFNTLFALFALYLILRASASTLFFSGLCIGLLWFYWMGYSFKYTNTGFMLPIIDTAIAIGYGVIFLLLALGNTPYWRALILFALSYFEPMDFNWLTFELLFVDAYLPLSKSAFALILLALALPITRAGYGALALSLLLSTSLFHLFNQKRATVVPPLDMVMHQTTIDQAIKWKKPQRIKSVQENFAAINEAINAHHDLIILPESAFALYLDKNPQIEQRLRQLSHHISIVSGVLYHEGNRNYNVSILAQNGEIYIAKKMVLVPFGEYVPLPKFAQKIISDTFFNGAADFIGATSPTDFTIKGITFRSAICYEATCKELFANDPAFMIAISNNAWFIPSIEPTLQRYLMRYYATLHNTTIYHVANGAGGGIVYPNP